MLWKDFKKFDHHLIVEKIKELFVECEKKSENLDQVKICQTLTFDLIFFYSHKKILLEEEEDDNLFKQA